MTAYATSCPRATPDARPEVTPAVATAADFAWRAWDAAGRMSVGGRPRRECPTCYIPDVRLRRAARDLLWRMAHVRDPDHTPIRPGEWPPAELLERLAHVTVKCRRGVWHAVLVGGGR
jgi:hypothetical protein